MDDYSALSEIKKELHGKVTSLSVIFSELQSEFFKAAEHHPNLYLSIAAI